MLKKLLLTLLLFLFISLASLFTNDAAIETVEPVQTQTATTTPGFYKVLRIIDGDTISIETEGKAETVRLIGIDTPETVHPSKPVQCFGLEASAKMKELLEWKEVALETDASQGEQDRYGRKLAYVFVDGTNVNQYLIENGYAYEYTYDGAYKYQAEFKAAQRDAEENKRGLWADGVCEGE